VDDQMGRAVRPSENAPVAEGRFPGYDLSGAGSIELASPSPFSELGPLVFGYYTLDLDQQPALWVVQWRAVGEVDPDSIAGELIEYQNLISVGAGQAIRR
jgi:hypothetical protein